MNTFEQYLQEFNSKVELTDFLLSFLVTAFFSIVLYLFYIRFANPLSNRKRFAQIFLPLALTTMIIITVVKSSLALSLGLVGALSIVRFRTAIKDPEELTYLFLCIALGLIAGANQLVIAIIGFPIILLMIGIYKYTTGRIRIKYEDKMLLSIQSKSDRLQPLIDTVTKHLPYVELKRYTQEKSGIDLTLGCKIDTAEQLDTIKKELDNIAPDTRIALIKQPDIIA